jgi:hypothetical protein
LTLPQPLSSMEGCTWQLMTRATWPSSMSCTHACYHCGW